MHDAEMDKHLSILEGFAQAAEHRLYVAEGDYLHARRRLECARREAAKERTRATEFKQLLASREALQKQIAGTAGESR